MKLLDQLKERRLFRIVSAYILVGWIILQVFDQIADRGVVPDLVYHVALIWFVVGIPAALLIGWHHGEKGRQRAPASELVILLVLAVTAVGASALTIGAAREGEPLLASSESTPEMRSVAVRYFADISSSGELAYLADGLTEALIAELQQVQGLDVISRNGSARFRDSDLAPELIARELEVGTLVEGDIETRSNRLRVNLRLLDGDGNVFRRASIEEPLADLVTLRESVIREVALLLRQWIGEEVRVRDRAESTSSSTAWALVQRAERLRKDGDESAQQGDGEAADALFQQADSLLDQAEAADPAWIDPVIERAFVAYRRSRATRVQSEQAVFIRTGLGHVERALAREPNSARALELRGTLNYWSLLVAVVSDPAERERVLASAENDLSAAIRRDPTLATAHASLSHLHLYFTGNLPEAVLSAGRAIQQDAYLENIEGILDRAFEGSLNMGNFRAAKEWCTEGNRRFPGDYRFVNCQLLLMIAPFEPARPDSAWALLARLDSVAPQRVRDFQVIRGELMVGAVLGRAGMIDSARVVINRASSRATPEVDPGNDLLITEAYARIRSDEKSRAVDLLARRWAAGSDQPPPGGEVEWWWRDLQDDPRFRRIWGLN